MKKRIDQLVFEKGLTKSRVEAQRLILARKVRVDGQFITKTGTKIPGDSKIEVEKGREFVGRGAKKLESVHKKFKLDFKDKIVADIGASTGGFTDFALKNGARKVYAVDTGYGQLDYFLRKDERIINMERTDIRSIEKFPEKIDVFLIDVSFISLKKVLPKIKELMDKQNHKSEIIALVKPQFEVGKTIADKFKGVIEDKKIQRQIVKEIKSFADNKGFAVILESKSGLLGEKGNQEYFLYLRYPKKVITFGVFDLLHSGHKYFLKQAAKLGDLVVVVPPDKKVFKLKEKKPVYSQKERIKNIEKLGFKAEPEKENPWQSVLKNKADAIVLGYDQNWEEEIKKEIKKTDYLVKIIKIKKALKSEYHKTKILREKLTK